VAPLTHCSDHLEIHARNREVVRIFFVLDVCDREVIAWSAVAQAGWLPDNYCSAYLANDTADTARAVGLTLLFTPVRSPESNGMSEAFVKTVKRDYASITVLSDAATILALLPDWVEDSCEVHAHSE
jgi:putative transposase